MIHLRGIICFGINYSRFLINHILRFIGIRILKQHIVICGFPRTGSTLLYLMIATSIKRSQYFISERSALNMLKFRLHQEPILLTKRPDDILEYSNITTAHKKMNVKSKLIIMIRDPRNIMTSIHSRKPGYYISSNRWLKIYNAIDAIKSSDNVLVVKYEDLINRLDSVQNMVLGFCELKIKQDFGNYLNSVPKNFDIDPLNGLRPLDSSLQNRWQAPEHYDRIIYMLKEIPELSKYLIDLGYEVDDRWLDKYIYLKS